MQFQYITDLYDKGHDNNRTRLVIQEWLRVNVGTEGDARTNDVTTWAWSLTKYIDNRCPVGIYFGNTEDQLRFRLSFNIGHGRAE